MGFGQTNEKRQAAYRGLFRNELKPGIIDEISQATNGSFALGSERFKKEMAIAPRCRITPGKSGRPPNKAMRQAEYNYNFLA